MKKALDRTTTRVLLDEISRMHGLALLCAAIGGFFLGATVYEYEFGARESERILLYAGVAGLVGLVTLGFRWYMTRFLLPALESRAEELPPDVEPTGEDASSRMLARQRLGKWGLVVLLLGIPAGLMAHFLGPATPELGNLTLLAWSVVILFAATGLGMMIRSAQCPSCSKLRPRRMAGENESCPHCGTRLGEERV